MTTITVQKQILTNLNQKYMQLDSFLSSTKILKSAIERKDHYVIKTSIDMRDRTIMTVDNIDKKNGDLISTLPNELRTRISSILSPKGGETLRLENPLETNLFDTSRRVYTLIGKIAELDKEVTAMMHFSK